MSPADVPAGLPGRARALVHIGYHKTGTTALQRHVFPAIATAGLLTRDDRHGTAAWRVLSENLCEAPDGRYLACTLAGFLADAARSGGPDGLLVISDEELSGTVWAGGGNRERIAERLAALLPEAGVLICVRHQGAMIRSLYSLYVQKGGWATFPDFLAGRAPGFALDLDHLCYDRLVARYQALFGPERVCVLPYEQLTCDPAGFLGAVAAFAGTAAGAGALAPPASENTSLSAPSRWLLRRSNRWFRRSRFNDAPRFGDHQRARNLRFALQRAEPRLPAWWRRAGSDGDGLVEPLLGRYEGSNARLAELTGLDLGRHRYPGTGG